MTLLIPHTITIQRHTHLGFMWRAKCTCGWTALSRDEEGAMVASDEHYEAETPFPDMSLDEEAK